MTDDMGQRRGILFSSEMVRAILDDRKTQTRRLVNEKTLRVSLDDSVTNQNDGSFVPPHLAMTIPAGRYHARLNPHGAVSLVDPAFGLKPGEFNFCCPYAGGVTRLVTSPNCWLIRPFARQCLWVRETWRGRPGAVRYRADGEVRGARTPWRSGLHLPQRLARILLTVMEVRIERLHAITARDARAEGADDRGHYEALWRSIHGPTSWDANPFVWVVSFHRSD